PRLINQGGPAKRGRRATVARRIAETRPSDSRLAGMGIVMTKLTLENFADRENAASALIQPNQVRRVEVNALVDTGATTLVLPADIATKLGLPFRDRKTARMADGSLSDVARVTGLYIEILGRDMTGDALVVPSGVTPLIGQVQLEMLD